MPSSVLQLEKDKEILECVQQRARLVKGVQNICWGRTEGLGVFSLEEIRVGPHPSHSS